MPQNNVSATFENRHEHSVYLPGPQCIRSVSAVEKMILPDPLPWSGSETQTQPSRPFSQRLLSSLELGSRSVSPCRRQ